MIAEFSICNWFNVFDFVLVRAALTLAMAREVMRFLDWFKPSSFAKFYSVASVARA